VLVRNLLAFSRGEQAQPELIDAAAVAHEVVDLYRDSARQHGVDVECDLADGLDPVFMDREGLHSCLANLVSNALDACLVTRGEPCTIRVALREVDRTVIFEVSDSGCGMDYEVKQKAFTSFFTTKGAGGTGLGLLITRKIVQQHGGTITFESTPGQGTLFRLSFPRARLPRPTRKAEGGNAALEKAGPGRRRAAR
jgi:signal transduction histidine kinase